jgi:PAS domain-containing protein
MSHVHGGSVTTSVDASAILERARQMLRTLLDGMPDPVTLFDLDRREVILRPVVDLPEPEPEPERPMSVMERAFWQMSGDRAKATEPAD